MLELHEAEGAFERIEGWLRDHGFFRPGGEDLVADLYLGYGLSSTIRRTTAPAPPEPCSLPLAACLVRRGDHTDVYRDNGGDSTEGDVDAEAVVGIGDWRRTWATTPTSFPRRLMSGPPLLP